MNQLIVKTFTAGGAIAHGRLVKVGAADGAVLQCSAAADGIFGVSDCPGGVAQGGRVDVVLLGMTELEFGGTVARGTLVTSDADGKAVAAAPAAGVNNGTGGRNAVTAAAGDRLPHFFIPGQIQGA